MRHLLFILLFTKAVFGAATIPVNTLITWEGLPRGPVPTNEINGRADGFNVGTIGSYTYWIYESTSNNLVSRRWSVVPSLASYTLPLSLGGTNYTLNSGTNWLKSLSGTNCGDENLKLVIPQTTNILFGGFVKVCVTNSDPTPINLDLMQTAWGYFSVFEVQVRDGVVYACAHAQDSNGQSSPRPLFLFELCKTYLLLFHTDYVEGYSRVRLLDPDSGYALAGGSDSVMGSGTGLQGWPMFLHSGYIEEPLFPQGAVYWSSIFAQYNTTSEGFNSLLSDLTNSATATPRTVTATRGFGGTIRTP
jgi:hypothetical protein